MNMKLMNKEKQEVKEESVSVDSETLLYIRLIFATVLFVIALCIKSSALIKTLFFALAAAVLCYDIVFEALDSIENKKFFAPSIIVIFVTFACFLIGFAYEGTALVIIYQIGGILLKFAADLTKKSAQQLYSTQDSDSITKLNAILGVKSSTDTKSYKEIKFSSERILEYALIVAIIYAIVMPFVTNMRWDIAIHRALTIFVICTPISICASIPLANYTGLSLAGKYGIIFRNAKAMESITEAKLAFVDKAGVLSSEYPFITDVTCNGIDENTFLNFLAHAVYYSSQPFANAIADLYKDDYRTELIDDFEDIEGVGVRVKIGGNPVVFAKSGYFDAEEEYSSKDNEDNTFCLYIAGRHFGNIVYNYNNYEEAYSILSSLKKNGITKCVLLTDDDKIETEAFASKVGADEFYSELDVNTKLQLVKNYKESLSNDKSVFIYSTGIESHSASDLDIRVGEKGKFADIVIKNDYLANLPDGLEIARRTKEIYTENAIFAFVMKALLIFLTFLGKVNVWFSIFLDTVVALATILNCSRVGSESLIANLKYKMGKD